jgi:hypothetical protein
MASMATFACSHACVGSGMIAAIVEGAFDCQRLGQNLEALACGVPSTKRASLYSVVDAAMRHTQKSHFVPSDEKGPQHPASK